LQVRSHMTVFGKFLLDGINDHAVS
jgi:hypothetical protein